MILAGDIGGTHARLALYNLNGDRLELVRHDVYLSRNYRDLVQVLRHFLEASPVAPVIEAACFGVAGPVINDRVVVSNLPWIIERENLELFLKTRCVWLLNDLTAATNGIDELNESMFVELNPGKVAPGNRAVLFVGTGLGECLSVGCNGHYTPCPSEGGHSDFSPKNPFEMDLYEHLSLKFGHVSWERVLSGHGIVNLYEFFQKREPLLETERYLASLESGDPSIAIMIEAQTGENANCVRARDLFIRFLGREAGNLALKFLALGGVYLGGGAVAHISQLLKRSEFLREFSSKGRMSEVLLNIPVRVVLSDDIGLLGAARYAVTSREKVL